MDRLETREIDYFVAVAEELHFGRAAERLGIAQPPLSRAIGRLERRLDVRLFQRTSRSVALTPAGSVFLTECRKVLDALSTAVNRTARAGRPARLVVAVRPGSGSGLLGELVGDHRGTGDHDGTGDHGGTGVDVVFTHDQPAALRSGTADVALLCAETEDLSGLRTLELAREQPVALLPRNHRLGRRSSVTTRDLREEEHFEEKCPPASLDEILDRVAFGRLVTVVGSSAVERLGSRVVAVPVEDLPWTTLVLGWPDKAPPPGVQAFAEAARAVAARHRSGAV